MYQLAIRSTPDYGATNKLRPNATVHPLIRLRCAVRSAQKLMFESLHDRRGNFPSALRRKMYIIPQHKRHRHSRSWCSLSCQHSSSLSSPPRDGKANRQGRRILSPTRQAIDCDAILHPQVSTHVLIPGSRQKIDVRELGWAEEEGTQCSKHCREVLVKNLFPSSDKKKC